MGCNTVAEHESYGIVLQRILRDPSLSAEAKAIYAYLCTFAGSDGTCYPSVSILCKELDISETRFYRHMKQLTTRGIVTVEKSRNGSRFSQNVYSISRTSVSPSRRNEGTEKRVPVLPSPRNSGTKNESINNTSLTNTRGLNITSTTDFYAQVCTLLNKGKAKASSKGRLKVESAWALDYILEHGLSQAEVLQAAHEAADNGMDLDWWSFRDYCKKSRRQLWENRKP